MTAVYYSFCALSVLCAWLAEKKNSKILFAISAILIAVIAGGRAQTVGIDTEVYYTYIDWAERDVLNHVEIGFTFLAKHLFRLFGEIKWVVFFFSALTVVFAFVRFWTLRENASYAFMVFFYLAFYLQLSMNVMRQFFAISIVFFATLFIEKKKYLIFAALSLLALLFHSSSIFAAVIFVIYYWNGTKRGIKKLALLIAICASVPIAYSYLGSLFNSYSDYFEEMQVDIGLMGFAKIGLLALFIIFNRLYIFKNGDGDSTAKTVTVIYAIGLSTLFLGYLFRYMERVSFAFMMFEPVCLSMMCSKHYKGFFRLATVALAAFIIVTAYTSNGNGIFPYAWIF